LNAELEIVQDNRRERQIADLCGLKPAKSRSGADAHDAKGNPFELKSGTKGSFTTARDVGIHTLAEWRSKYWIFAMGRNLTTGFEIQSLHIAHPDHLEPYFSKIESRLEKELGYGREALEAAKSCGVAKEKLEKVWYLISRGVTLNNPKIPFALVQENGTALPYKEPSKVQDQVKRFVAARPLKK